MIVEALDKIWETKYRYAAYLLGIFFVLQILYMQFARHVHIFEWLVLLVIASTTAFFLLRPNENEIEELATEVTAADGEDEYATFLPPEPGSINAKELRGAIDTALSTDDVARAVELEAQKEGVLLSDEGIKVIANSKGNALNMLGSLVDRANKTYPKLNGWTALTKERIEVLTKEAQQKYLPAQLAPGTLQSDLSAMTSTFVHLLCQGQTQDLFDYIHTLKGDSEWLRKFATEVTLLLDSVHRHRMYGTGYVDPYVLQESACVDDTDLEQIVTILASGLDFRYEQGDLEPKLALFRVAEYMESRKVAH